MEKEAFERELLALTDTLYRVSAQHPAAPVRPRGRHPGKHPDRIAEARAAAG